MNYRLQKLLFLLLVFLLPTQFGLHFWPDFAFINGIRIDYFSPTLYLTDILIVAILTLSLRAPCLPAGRERSNLKNKLKDCFVVSLLAMTFVVINIYFSISPLLSLYKWLKVFEFVMLIIWIKNNFKKEWLSDFLKVFSISIFIQVVLAIAQFINQGSVNGLFYFFGERTLTAATPGIALGNYFGQLMLRPYGTFSHPNVLAAFMFVAIIIFYRLSSETGFKYRWVIYIVATATILLTISRLSFISLFIFVIVNFFGKMFVNIRLSLIILIVLFGIFLFVFKIFGVINIDQSMVIREKMLSAGISIIKNYWLTGTGLGTNIMAMQKYSLDLFFNSQPLSFLQPVHNIYILFISETGVAGFFILIYIVFKLFLDIKAWRTELLIILFMGFFDHYFITLQQGQLLICLLLGIILWCQKLSGQLPQTLSTRLSEK